jgi:4-hydroxy-tetrahydrodipicolinate reductase
LKTERKTMKKIMVMVAGLPGKMATLVAEAIAKQEDMELYPYGLSENSKEKVQIGEVPVLGSTNLIHLVPGFEQVSLLESGRTSVDLIVDFTLPKSVNYNAELYCHSGIPFVMGTTGGNREKLVEVVKKSDISAVVATNMAAPVVMFQAMIKFAAENFPHALDGFKLVIRESHQAEKIDPSGTAISLLDSFEVLGMPLRHEQIIMVRDTVVQEVEMGIPKQYLSGHGYHTYTLLSRDGTVMLQHRHNVLGRNVYVDGALRARFLAPRRGEKGNVYSMIDVLRG